MYVVCSSSVYCPFIVSMSLTQQSFYQTKPQIDLKYFLAQIIFKRQMCYKNIFDQTAFGW